VPGRMGLKHRGQMGSGSAIVGGPAFVEVLVTRAARGSGGSSTLREGVPTERVGGGTFTLRRIRAKGQGDPGRWSERLAERWQRGDLRENRGPRRGGF
jgi:hypothetical protein